MFSSVILVQLMFGQPCWFDFMSTASEINQSQSKKSTKCSHTIEEERVERFLGPEDERICCELVSLTNVRINTQNPANIVSPLNTSIVPIPVKCNSILISLIK